MTAKKQDYAHLQQQLAKTIDALQVADLDIDEASKHYETGMKVIADLERHVKNAETKVEKLKIDFGRQKSGK